MAAGFTSDRMLRSCLRRTGASSSGSMSRRISRALPPRRRRCSAADEPSDLKTISDYANQYSPSKPILIGISEGAGLSVLAAADSITQRSIAGVIGIGLPDRNELGWRWRDSLIYLTHGIPNEPTFSAASFIGKVSPLPLALVHSTHDEFAPLADAQRMIGLGGDPKRLWVVDASDHRFSDNLSDFDQSLLAALDWVTQHTPR